MSFCYATVVWKKAAKLLKWDSATDVFKRTPEVLIIVIFESIFESFSKLWLSDKTLKSDIVLQISQKKQIYNNKTNSWIWKPKLFHFTEKLIELCFVCVEYGLMRIMKLGFNFFLLSHYWMKYIWTSLKIFKRSWYN